MKAGKPLVLHNGLIDLIFMYHNLWTALPPKLDTFISDVSQMFPAGVYDTKYVADYVARTQVDFVIPYNILFALVMVNLITLHIIFMF